MSINQTTEVLEQIVVSTKDGKVRGIKQNSQFCKQGFYSFHAIPYAQPPIGNLRFKDPVEIKPWKSIRDATIEKQGCAQFSLLHIKFMGTEDCLYVNIHTPKLPILNEPLKAVVALIHGGGILWGSADSSHFGSPNFIMDRNIVYVTIGFRINIFGFLNLQMEACSGNQGLKDIILALKWIKDNVQYFNGDPNNITILGSSSGASLVHILMLSPAVQGLYHKAILLGNLALNSLVVRHDDHITQAFDYARHVGFKGTSKKQLLTFLKRLPTIAIVESIRTFQDKFGKDAVKAAFGSLFTASIDQGKHAILPTSPRKLVSSMELVPIICGICERESLGAFTAAAVKTTEARFHKWHRQNSWGWTYFLDDDEFGEMMQEVEYFYSEKIPRTNSSLSVKETILSDVEFSEMYDTLINPVAAKFPSSTYVYMFQYEGELNLSKKAINEHLVEKFSDSSFLLRCSYHFDDFYYWAQVEIPTLPETLQMVKMITKIFTNFAKTGNPNFDNMNVQWKSSTPTEPCYLSINETLTMIDGKLNNERYEFWDELKKRYRRDPIQ